MAEKKSDIEAEKERLSEMFGHETDDSDENFSDDPTVIEADIDEEFSDKEEEKPDVEAEKDVIFGEVVEDRATEPYLQFLEAIPRDEDVTIVVSRYADKNLGGQFRVPCNIFGVKLSLYWSGENNPEELYQQVQREIGGGRYLFQIRNKGKGWNGKSWTAIVHDAPDPSKLELTLQRQKTNNDEHRRNRNTSQSFVNQQPIEPPRNSMDDLLENIEKIELLRELLAPKQETAPAANPSTAESSFEDRIIMKVLERTTDNPKLEEKVVNAVFGIVEKKENKQEGFIDLAKHALSNPEQVKGLFDMVVGSLGGAIGAVMANKKPGGSQKQPSGLDAFRAAPKVEFAPSPPSMAETHPEPPQTPIAAIPIIKLED
jgi:hypothetical protein